MTHRLKKLSTLVAMAAGLSACALAPNSAEPSWTDARLAEHPPSQAPRTVSEDPAPPGTAAQINASVAAALRARDQVIATGLSLGPPDISAAEFVVEARRRAQPPAQN